jgi:hypothetical protein
MQREQDSRDSPILAPVLRRSTNVHDVFQGGAVVEVNAWPEAATAERGKRYHFLSMRFGRAIQFQSQSDDDELVQRNPTVQSYLASLLQQSFIERDGGAHAIMMLVVITMMSRTGPPHSGKQEAGIQSSEDSRDDSALISRVGKAQAKTQANDPDLADTGSGVGLQFWA